MQHIRTVVAHAAMGLHWGMPSGDKHWVMPTGPQVATGMEKNIEPQTVKMKKMQHGLIVKMAIPSGQSGIASSIQMISGTLLILQ